MAKRKEQLPERVQDGGDAVLPVLPPFNRLATVANVPALQVQVGLLS